MELNINKEKFEIFLEVTKALNESFGVIPVLYASLGLNRVIGEFGKANDIDILVPDKFVHEKWEKLVNLMQALNFELKDEHEHEFIRREEVVAFATEIDLIRLAKVDPNSLKISKVDGVNFKELSPEQYLAAYQSMLRDNYRQEKRGGADQEKIALIQKYIRKQKMEND